MTILAMRHVVSQIIAMDTAFSDLPYQRSSVVYLYLAITRHPPVPLLPKEVVIYRNRLQHLCYKEVTEVHQNHQIRCQAMSTIMIRKTMIDRMKGVLLEERSRVCLGSLNIERNHQKSHREGEVTMMSRSSVVSGEQDEALFACEVLVVVVDLLFHIHSTVPCLYMHVFSDNESAYPPSIVLFIFKGTPF
jgi:hypothetical protein